MLDGLTITGVALAERAASDILQTGVDAGHTHGFGYWGQLKDIKERILRPVTDAGQSLCELTIMDVEADEPKTYVVDIAAVQLAVIKMITDPAGTDSAGWTRSFFDDDGLDGPLADAIIQVACFGKVIYG